MQLIDTKECNEKSDSTIIITSPVQATANVQSADQTEQQEKPAATMKLNLIQIDELAMCHAVDIFEMLLFETEIRGDEFVATNAKKFDAYLGRFKFNLKTAEWSYDPNAEDLQAIKSGAINEMTYYKNRAMQYHLKNGTGVISYIAYMCDCTALLAAKVIKEWLDEHNQSTSDVIALPDHKTHQSSNRTELNKLYGLNTLREDADSSVILCSGEQAAYAVRFLLPNFSSVATRNGAILDDVDLSPLKGRSVIIWANHGSTGSQFEKFVSAALLKLDRRANVFTLKPLMYLPEFISDCIDDGQEIPKNVRMFDLKARKEPLQEGYNATDAFADGWTLGYFTEIFGKLLKEVPYKFETKRIGSFLVSENGIYEIKYRDGEEVLTPISSLVEVTAQTRDKHSKNWGLLLNFTDRDGHLHEWAMPKELLASKDEYRQILLSMGVDIHPTGTTKLPEYFIAANPSERALCVNTIGWHGDVFVLPGKSYGKSDERVILQNTDILKISPYATKGTLFDWQRNIGNKCVGNSRLILAASAALTGPFLDALKLENGGFHFRGESSTGKTKVLTIGASMWGGKAMVKQWKSTGNAIEGTAREHSYTGLFLDELSQVSSHEAGDVIYTLGNGQAKARANVNGDTKSIANWRLLFLSTGEISLADHIATSGGKIKAGQEVRLLDIPSDAGAGMGVFETIHGADSPASFANNLQNFSETYYGTPADTLLTKLTQLGELNRASTFILKAQEEFVQHCVPKDSHGQISRAASRFGAVAGVGEYCISIGILPWETGQANWGVSKCFAAWLESRGDNTASEDIRALAQVREFIERNGESRFTLMQATGIEENNIGYRTINRAGFRRVLNDGSTEYWVLPEMFKSEMCEGFDPILVKRVLSDNGYLELDRAGKSSITKRVPGAGNMRVYVIKPALMQTDEDDC